MGIGISGQLFPSWFHLFQLLVSQKKKKNYEDGALISFTYFHNNCGFHFQFIEWSHRFNLHKWPLDMQRSNYVKSKISIDIGEQLFRYVHDVKENKCPTREFANISIELIMAAEEWWEEKT